MNMNSTKLTQQTNAHSGRWFATVTELESVEYKLVEPALPSINSGVTELGGRDDAVLFVPGDRIQFDEVSITFFIDELYTNYLSCYAWMRQNVNMNDPKLRDVTIVLMDAQGKPQGVSITYKDCFPINLSPIIPDNSGAVSDMTATLTMKFTDMEFMHPTVAV